MKKKILIMIYGWKNQEDVKDEIMETMYILS